MKTHPYPEVTINAPKWMRNNYRRITGKTIDERYKEKVEELMVEIISREMAKTFGL